MRFTLSFARKETETTLILHTLYTSLLAGNDTILNKSSQRRDGPAWGETYALRDIAMFWGNSKSLFICQEFEESDIIYLVVEGLFWLL